MHSSNVAQELVSSETLAQHARAFLEQSDAVSLLRISTAGSVDDGKSTFIGRLLHDTDNVYDDHLVALKKASNAHGLRIVGDDAPLEFALLTDGLKAEREQGITIDVAYRYFSTAKRRFILADSPGHEQYTRNMATAASCADLTIILVDAVAGLVTQTRRHAFIAALLGVPRVLLAVNKMDLVEFEQQVFDKISAEFQDFAARLGVQELRCIPISALKGDNVARRSTQMPWYQGESVLEYLENVYVAGDANRIDLRFPIQGVIRGHDNKRYYCGSVASGELRLGDEIVALPSLRRSRITAIHRAGAGLVPQLLESAGVRQAVSICLADEIDLTRGDMLARPNNAPKEYRKLDAMLIWLGDEALSTAEQYILLHTTRKTRCTVSQQQYQVDVNSLHRQAATSLEKNSVARVGISLASPIFADPYQRNRSSGNFILVHPLSGATVAAGMILDRTSVMAQHVPAQDSGTNLHPALGLVSPSERAQKSDFVAKTIWCTGLSGSGKSTVAEALERRMFDQGRAVFRLDGDMLRQGLCRDLGFSANDRAENIRRAAEVAKLFNQAGVTVICALISPFANDRQTAREIVGDDRFIEVYFSTPLAVCEARDPHNLYARARAGEIKGFTGIDAPYEAPREPRVTIDTSSCGVGEGVEIILSFAG